MGQVASSSGQALVGRAFGFAALVTMAVLLVSAADTPHAREVIPYAAAALLIPLLPILIERHPDPFSPPVITGVYGFVGLSAAIFSHVLSSPQLVFPELGLSGPRAVEKTIAAFNVLSVASAAYLVGYYGTVRGIGKGLLPDVHGLVWDQRRLLYVSLLLGAIFVGCYAYFQARIGTGIFELSLAEGKAVWRDDPTLSWMIRGIGLGQVPILLYGAVLLRRGSRGRVLLLGALAVVVAYLTMRTGGRGFALYFLIALGVMFHYLRRRIPSWFLLTTVVAAVLSFNVLATLRLGGEDALEYRPASFRATEVLEQHEDDRQRLLPMVTIVHFFPERRDYLLGETWAGIVAAPIPRWVWPGKVDAFRMRDTQIIMELVGAPTPCPLQFLLFANFGWVGVVGGMTLWGAFHRRLARWREEAGGDGGTTLLYAIMLFHFGPTLLQLSGTMQWIIPCWLAILFVGRRALPSTSHVVALKPSR